MTNEQLSGAGLQRLVKRGENRNHAGGESNNLIGDEVESVVAEEGSDSMATPSDPGHGHMANK